jgi:hypothetical protein
VLNWLFGRRAELMGGGDAKHRTMMRNCASENLEISGLMLTRHPGMTVEKN